MLALLVLLLVRLRLFTSRQHQTPRSAHGQQEGLTGVATKALGTTLPGNGRLGLRTICNAHSVHSARYSAPRKREPSKNIGHRTPYRALEAWYGSAESSLRRPSALAEPLFHLAAPAIPQQITGSKRSPSPEQYRDTAPAKVGSNITSTGSP